MSISNVLGIANSGMRLATRQLEQSAQNVANVNTDGYEASVVVSRSQPDGGVTGTSAPTYTAQGFALRGADAPTAQSNTDIADETVTQMTSLRAFQANVAVMRTADEMLGELVNRNA